jgi:molecular chaperone DnaK
MSFGIDFGTTNSAVVYNRNLRLGLPGERPFPSVVAISKLGGTTLCGPDAVAKIDDEGYEVIRSVKRCLDVETTFVVGGKVYRPVDIVRILFQGLKQHVQKLKQEGLRAIDGQSLNRAVVSVPVNFHPLRRKLLRQAAEGAGITIADFASEPTSAFIHCRESLAQYSRVAVFDWGGGTLDACVLRVDQEGNVMELSSAVRYEAGTDIDLAIAQWAHDEVFAGRSDAPSLERVSSHDRTRLLARCESAKILLRSELLASITLNRYANVSNIAVELTRERLREIVSPFIDRALATLDEALRQATEVSGRTGIDQVLLIGGSSQLVALQEALHEHFPGKIFSPERPDWAVAQGASWLADRPGNYRLAHAVGLVLSDGRPHTIARVGDLFGIDLLPQYLALVDGAETAQLVFAEVAEADGLEVSTTSEIRRHLFNLEVPMQGFLDELLRLDVRLTENLTLLVRAQSEKGIAEDARTREFAELRCTFLMPQRR